MNVKRKAESDLDDETILASASGCAREVYMYQGIASLKHDFYTLAQEYPFLQRYQRAHVSTESSHSQVWSDACSSLAQSKALFAKDMCLNQCLQKHHLCPPQGRCHGYLYWVHSLCTCVLQDTHTAFPSVTSITDELRFLEIGVGVSAAMSMYLCKAYNWVGIGTDIDLESLHWSKVCVNMNSSEEIYTIPDQSKEVPEIEQPLVSKLAQPSCNPILVLREGKEDQLLACLPNYPVQPRIEASIGITSEEITFLQAAMSTSVLGEQDILIQAALPCQDTCICNPPFFETNEEAVRAHPIRECEGTFSELQTIGGETAFIAKMILETAQQPFFVKLPTSMIGKKSSLEPLVHFQRSEEIKDLVLLSIKGVYPLIHAYLAGTPRVKSHIRRKLPRESGNLSLEEQVITHMDPVMFPLVATHAYKQGEITRWALAWSFDPLLCAAASKYKLKSHLNRLRV